METQKSYGDGITGDLRDFEQTNVSALSPRNREFGSNTINQTSQQSKRFQWTEVLSLETRNIRLFAIAMMLQMRSIKEISKWQNRIYRGLRDHKQSQRATTSKSYERIELLRNISIFRKTHLF
jgi:uncharacterized protein (DUF4213/DUF364 family)